MVVVVVVEVLVALLVVAAPVGVGNVLTVACPPPPPAGEPPPPPVEPPPPPQAVNRLADRAKTAMAWKSPALTVARNPWRSHDRTHRSIRNDRSGHRGSSSKLRTPPGINGSKG